MGAGRLTALTPRGEDLRPFTTDHVLLVLGLAVDRILREEAPDACLRFLPNVRDPLPAGVGTAG